VAIAAVTRSATQPLVSRADPAANDGGANAKSSAQHAISARRSRASWRSRGDI
jgi:hypothetical protein